MQRTVDKIEIAACAAACVMDLGDECLSVNQYACIFLRQSAAWQEPDFRAATSSNLLRALQMRFSGAKLLVDMIAVRGFVSKKNDKRQV